ncbi:MAG: hypothetical protein V1813_03505 [Candidatus Aenigmatarchaeota archaeon]
MFIMFSVLGRSGEATSVVTPLYFTGNEFILSGDYNKFLEEIDGKAVDLCYMKSFKWKDYRCLKVETDSKHVPGNAILKKYGLQRLESVDNFIIAAGSF